MESSITTSPMPENKFGIRHIIAIMGFFATILISTYKLCLSISITEMVKYYSEDGKIDEHSCPFVQMNTTIIKHEGEFDWDTETQGLILSSSYWGNFIMLIPGGLMAERWGVKWVIGFSVFVSSIGTLLTPLIARTLGSWGLICLRVIMGCTESPVHPSFNVAMSFWSSVHERGRLAVIVFSGTYVGNFISMALSGAIISNFGWAGPFYVFGGIGLVWCIIWVVVYYNTPFEHPFIKEGERAYITTNSGKTCYKDLPPTPWIPILTSIPLWGHIIAQIGHDWALYTVATDLASYMKSVLHVSVEKNGVVSGLPHLGMGISSFVFGWIGDLMIVKCRCRRILVRRIFNTIATVGTAIGIVAASYSGCNVNLTIIFFVFGMTMMGSYITGLKVNVLDLSSNYAGTLLAMGGTGGSLSGMLTPYLTGVLTPDSTLLEWRLVFWIAFALIIGSNIVYIIMGSADTQWWDNPDKVRSHFKIKGKDNLQETRF